MATQNNMALIEGACVVAFENWKTNTNKDGNEMLVKDFAPGKVLLLSFSLEVLNPVMQNIATADFKK